VWANFPCYQIFRILAAWKCDFCRFVKPTFQGTLQRVEIFLIFEALNSVLPCREIHVARILSFVLSNFSHFSSLKMRFLPIRGTNVLRYLAKRGNFLHFSCLKMRFCAVVKCTFQRHQASWVQIFRILAARKCDFCRFVKSTFQGTSQRWRKFS